MVEADAAVKTKVDAVVLVRDERVPEVCAVVATPVAFRSWAIVTN